EWQSVRSATAKFPDHDWPRKPRWGYVNEADPAVMALQIDAACDHGVNTFISDWYWYDERPFLEQCLNDGFLQAPNRARMRFFLMWANHDATDLWDKRTSDHGGTVLWRGAVDRAAFEHMATRLITRYFTQPNYYRIDDKPVFQIYDIPGLVRGLGGMAATRDALDWFRAEVMRHGFPGLHLLFTMWSEAASNLSGVDSGKTVPASAFGDVLGFDSATHYQYVHFTDIDRTYEAVFQDVAREWAHLSQAFSFPYYPHVSIGWDNNPRFSGFRPGILRDNTPAQVEHALRAAKAYVDAHPLQAPLITINSWNEWTESSYLQPDDRYGYGYLEAVRRVFSGLA
ncbi:MAG: glycoside hydrolase family 99-like domain-containing protein, partial [Clostridia bacterium]